MCFGRFQFLCARLQLTWSPSLGHGEKEIPLQSIALWGSCQSKQSDSTSQSVKASLGLGQRTLIQVPYQKKPQKLFANGRIRGA